MSIQYTAIVFITAFSMLAMMAAVQGNNCMERARRRGFLALFGLLIAANAAEWLAADLDGAAASLRGLHILAKFLELSITPVIPAVCAAAVGGERKKLLLMGIPGAVNLILQGTSLFTGAVFTVDAANLYARGPLYPLYMATFVLGAGFLLLHCYRFSRHYQYRDAIFLSLIMVLVFAAMALPILNRELRLDWACISIAAILFYVYYDQLIQQIDPLTALLNRHSYSCRLESLREPAAILFFDVDRFKLVNDTCGHAFGDVSLTRLAAEIRSVFGKYGHCYRFGGDEFCAILTREDTDPDELISVFLHRLEDLRQEEPRLPRVSVGYALYDPARERVEDALKRADAMMYDFKQKRHREEDARLQETASAADV